VSKSEVGTERHNLERTALFYEALFSRNWAGVNEILSPDVVVHEPVGLPYGGEHRGHDGFRGLMRNLAEYWSAVHPEDVGYTAAGDVVHMETTLVATARATGREVRLPFIESWTFRDGRMVSGIIYYSDTYVVREALGLA
jgi:ketosteroid isomerase-like protein